MVFHVHRNHKAYYGRGQGVEGGMEVGGRGIVYTYRYTATTKMTPALKMGSNESHFNVSLIVMNKVTRQCPQTTTSFRRKRRAEAESSRGPSAYQPNALHLGETGSLRSCTCAALASRKNHPPARNPLFLVRWFRSRRCQPLCGRP